MLSGAGAVYVACKRKKYSTIAVQYDTLMSSIGEKQDQKQRKCRAVAENLNVLHVESSHKL